MVDGRYESLLNSFLPSFKERRERFITPFGRDPVKSFRGIPRANSEFAPCRASARVTMPA